MSEKREEPCVSMLVVRGLLHAAEQAGVQRDELVQDASQLEDADARMPQSQLFRVMELLVARSPDPALGLHWVERQLERSFGPVAHMLVYAATLRQAIALLTQFERLIYDGPAIYAVTEHPQTVSVRQVGWRGPSERTRAFLSESALTGFLKLVRVYFANARAVSVRFEHADPGYAREYERVFGTLVEFAQPCSEIVFERALLDAPSPHADPTMYSAQRTLAERRLLQVTRAAPYAVRVRELVREHFPARVNMAEAARALGISERSLRSELSVEGTSYRDVEHDTLGVLVRELLLDPTRTIQEVAYYMGFSDATTFHRAVKRWTGLTPTSLRARP